MNKLVFVIFDDVNEIFKFYYLFIFFIFKENETNKIDLKDATVTLYTLIAELAKHDVDSSTVVTLLEDYGFGSDKINSFKENYEVLVQFLLIING